MAQPWSSYDPSNDPTRRDNDGPGWEPSGLANDPQAFGDGYQQPTRYDDRGYPGSHDPGSYDPGSYGQGSYGPGPYGQDPYNQGSYSEGAYAQGAPYGQGIAGQPPYPQPGYPAYQGYPAHVGYGRPKSKAAAAVLAFFLGAFGIHNFYLGHIGRGIAQLLISLLSVGLLAVISVIWALIEFVLILTDSIPDAEGRPLS